jgi:hypothetical protein
VRVWLPVSGKCSLITVEHFVTSQLHWSIL